jgi:hypothetical protein
MRYARDSVVIPLCLTLVLAAPALAQNPPAGNQPVAGPPVRRIATASAVSTEQIGTITSVRELPGGRVLVNDGARRRLVLMDTTLKTVEVVLDSLTEVENSYGTRAGALIPYRGDSTLFIDPASYAMLVIDPTGKVARVRSVPRVEDAGRFAGNDANTRAGIDTRGRIVYRIPARPGPPLIAPPKGVPYFPPEPDSAFIVAIDLDTRKIDTLGSIRIPKSLSTVRRTPTGGFNFYEVLNPMPSTDEWTVRSDGVVAFVRGVDYRIDFLHGDGTWTSSPKLPFEWQRITEEDKTHLIDSVKAEQRRSAMGSYVRSMIRWVNQYGKAYPANFTVPESYRLENGLSRDWKLPPGLPFPPTYIFACGPNETPTMIAPPAGANADSTTPPDRRARNPADSSSQRQPPPGRPDGRGQGRPDGRQQGRPGAPGGFPGRGAGGPPGDRPGFGPGAETLGRPSCIPGPVVVTGGNAPPPPTIRESGVMSASDLPDYRPPFSNGAVRADADGNLWIRPSPPKPTPGGAVYDIVSNDGELTDRLQLPQGYNLVGFGRGKVVYLSMRDANGVHLARVLLR